MSRQFSDYVNLNSVLETALGVPATSGWRSHEPNSIDEYGADIKTVERRPLSINRQLRKGDVVDLDSMVKIGADLTGDLINDFAEGLFLSVFKNSGNTGTARFVPTAVTATGYTVAANGALTNGILVFARGAANAANNGLKVLAGTSTGTEIKTTGLVAEAIAGAYPVTVEVAGWRGAAGTIGLDASGDLTDSASTLASLGLQVGQWIWVGGTIGSAFAFNTAAYRGFARIKTIAAGKLTLERRSWTVGAADAGAAKTIDIYFGRWVRNVAANHGDYSEKTYTTELHYPTLGTGATPEYEYAKGNYVNMFELDAPQGDKVTVSLDLMGTTTDDPVTVRATGASAAVAPLANGCFNTAADLLRIRVSNVDESGLTTDVSNAKISFSNNVGAEKVLGTLGAKYMNLGKFEVKVTGEFLFTSSDVVKAIRDHRTVSFDLALRDDTGCLLIDVPSMTVNSGKKKIAEGESVKLDIETGAFQDATLGCSASWSLFPYLPTA